MAQKILVNTVQVATVLHIAGSSYDSVREAQLIVAIDSVGGRFADPTPEVLAAAAHARELHNKGQTPSELDGVMIANVTNEASGTVYDDAALPHTGASTVQAAIDWVKAHSGSPLSDSTPSNLGSAAPGDATSVSRANHVHGHGALAGGTLHADVIAGGASGFMPGADKTKLDGIAAATPIQDIFYIGPLGSDTTGNGTEGKPFATLQKAYDTWFPSGTPLTWPEFDRKRIFQILPGTTAATAGNLVAACCNFIIEGFGSIGTVTYDVKSEVMATFTGASANYETNTIHVQGGGGFGWNTSSADSTLITGDFVVSNFNTISRELNLSFEECQVQLKTQARVVPGGVVCPIYIRAIDTVFIYCESGVNALGNMPMTFSLLRDCVFRNQVNATKGSIGFADMQGCYFRRGFVGDPGIASMVSVGVFRGWEVNHLKYAFDVSAYPQELRMDYPTWKYIKEEAAPVLGTCTVKLTDQFGGVSGSRPTGVLPSGMCYFDTTLGRPVWWSGAAWLGADGLAA